MRQMLSSLLMGAVMVLAGGYPAEASEPKFEEGVHYIVLPQPVRTANPARIEVTEVFWYGCKHCYKFSPKVNSWGTVLPEDVDYVRTPAVWHPRMDLHARAYYAAKSLKVLDKVHPRLFDAMNAKKLKLKTEREIADVFASVGVDRDEFSSAFNSFGVVSQSMQAQARSKGYRITGTPAIIVNGKYRISGKSAGGNEKMLEVAEFLIERERSVK